MATNRMIADEQRDLYAAYEKYNLEHYKVYKKYLKEFISKDNLKMVDVGGGSGNFARMVKTYFAKNATNVSMTLVDYCDYPEWERVEGINFVKMSAHEYISGLEDESVDILFLNAILHHLTFDTYRQTRSSQRELLELSYAKLKQGGILCMRENYSEIPLVGNLTTPIIYYLTSSRLSIIEKMARRFGSTSAGVGVCFLSPKVWQKTFTKIGFTIIDATIFPWWWSVPYLIRSNRVAFVLKK